MIVNENMLWLLIMMMIMLIGTLSKDDDDRSENVGKKNEFAFFQT